MADALSRICMLVTKLELSVIGFENIKDLYAHDPNFASPMPSVGRIHLGNAIIL